MGDFFYWFGVGGLFGFVCVVVGEGIEVDVGEVGDDFRMFFGEVFVCYLYFECWCILLVDFGGVGEDFVVFFDFV